MMVKDFFKKNFGTTLGLTALLLRWFSGFVPEFVEKYYSRGLFPIIRSVFDNSLAYAPFPLIYVFYAAIFIQFVKLLNRLFSRDLALKLRFIQFFGGILNLVGVVVFSFFALWGFNYARLPLNKNMGFEVEKLDSTKLFSELETTLNETLAARAELTENAFSTNFDLYLSNNKVFENTIRETVSAFSKENGLPHNFKLRGRQLAPEGVLLRFGVSGVYMPFVGEANIDAALHPLEKPFSLAHEFAHGFGWGDEATCNFIAYLACSKSTNPFTKYSGKLNYFRYVAANYRKIDPEKYALWKQKSVSTGIKNDLEAIALNAQKFPTLLNTDKIYDSFLKTQGMKSGIATYSRVVLWVHAWRKKSNPDLK
jgi:hypothetical protein